MSRQSVGPLLLLAALLAAVAPGYATMPAAAQGPPADGCSRTTKRTCGAATGEGDFGVVVSEPGAPGGAGEARPVGDRPANADAPPLELVQYTYEPTCSLNRPENGGALCNAALGACPIEGDVAYWVYTRMRNTQTGATTAWARISDPPFVCRGATEPAPPTVPIEVLIGEELARQFASLPLPRATVQVSPNGQTLINIATRFHTTTATQPLAPLTLLGREVVVTAKAERYDWTMGDGTTYTDAGPGSPTTPIKHTYTQPASVGVTITTTWSGSFTVEGMAGTYPILGTATTTGPPTPVAVRSSRSELVSS